MSPKHQKCKHSIVSEDMIFGKMQMDVESPKCQNINALKNAKEVTTPSQKHHRMDVNDWLKLLRWVGRMDEWQEPKPIRHGRRPKSVWDPSSRVWEATTPVFSGVDEGVETTPFPLMKRRRVALSNCATFSDYRCVHNDLVCENRNTKNNARWQNVCLSNRSSLDTLAVK